MTTANVHEAKTNLSKLLNAASEGQEVIITRRGGKITRFKLQPLPDRKPKQLFGALKGKVVFAPDYDQADKELADMFEDTLG